MKQKLLELWKSDSFAGVREKVYSFLDSKKAWVAVIAAILAAIGFNVYERTDLSVPEPNGVQITDEFNEGHSRGDDSGSGQDAREGLSKETDLGVEEGLEGGDGSTADGFAQESTEVSEDVEVIAETESTDGPMDG